MSLGSRLLLVARSHTTKPTATAAGQPSRPNELTGHISVCIESDRDFSILRE